MSALIRLVFAFLVICALSGDTLAQTIGRASQTTSDRSAQAVRVKRPPRLDGTLDDPIWQQAIPIADFRQKEPYEGQPATERTEVRILYTHDEIYFGVVCRDSVAHGIVATQLRRDVTQELDDYFEIVIDSRHDRRNAYVFQVNPLGTQRDGLITDEQVSSDIGDGDPGWDGVWTSEARITEEGWTATIAIPFATLNFTHSTNVVWGLNLKRFIRRKKEEDLERVATKLWNHQD
jgi:Carbohydrate family 9 binding domain-like